jgi:sugar lactone lactonase YvrE
MSSATHWQTLPGSVSELGESPFWHPLEQMLYWVDIPGRKILRANVFMGTVDSWPLDQEPGCIAPARTGGLVVALRDGIYRARDWGGALQPIEPATHDTATTRFNDGKCDALGRLWAGTIYEPRTQALAELMCLDRRPGQPPGYLRKADHSTVANGLDFSPDNQTIYWANTPDHVVWAWDFDLTGATLSNRRVFQQFPPKPAGYAFSADGSHTLAYRGRPDGAAVDAAGNYWVAMFEGQRLCQFAPDGTLLAEVPTPTVCTTMPCFGGDDLRTLYITTARHNRSAEELEAQPDAGCVFSTRVATPGMPVNFYED